MTRSDSSGPDWDRPVLKPPQARPATSPPSRPQRWATRPTFCGSTLSLVALPAWRGGIYRLVYFPASEHEELVTAWLWSEQVGRRLTPDRACPPRPVGRAARVPPTSRFRLRGGGVASACRQAWCYITPTWRLGTVLGSVQSRPQTRAAP